MSRVQREERGWAARERRRKRERGKQLKKNQSGRSTRFAGAPLPLCFAFAPCRFRPSIRPNAPCSFLQSWREWRSASIGREKRALRRLKDSALRCSANCFFSLLPLHRRRRRRPSPSSASRRDRCNFFPPLFLFSPSAVPAFPCAASPFKGRPSFFCTLKNKEK